jgi:hypothetical protein
MHDKAAGPQKLRDEWPSHPSGLCLTGTQLVEKWICKDFGSPGTIHLHIPPGEESWATKDPPCTTK